MLNLRLLKFCFGQIAAAHQEQPQCESRDCRYDPDESLTDAGADCKSVARERDAETAADGRECSHDAARTDSDEKYAKRTDARRTGKQEILIMILQFYQTLVFILNFNNF